MTEDHKNQHSLVVTSRRFNFKDKISSNKLKFLNKKLEKNKQKASHAFGSKLWTLTLFTNNLLLNVSNFANLEGIP